MIRNLKALMLAGMALAVFGALAVSSAQAHTPARFHSDLAATTVTVGTDGTGKTAHQVFDVPGGGTVTCDGVKGHGVLSPETATSISVTLNFEHVCQFVGQTVEVHSTNCVFTFKANGEVELGGAGCKLAATLPGCEVKFTTPKTYTGITYHDISAAGVTLGSPGTATYTTVSAAVNGIHGEEIGAGCPKAGTFETGEFTTGNATVEGEPIDGGSMTSVWWTPTVA